MSMKTVFCMLLLIVLPAPLACARESFGKSLCPIDRKPIKKDLHVDGVGLRRYACSDPCPEKIKSMGSAVERRVGKQHPPARIPVKRSHERTPTKVLKDMVLVKGGEFVRAGKYHFRGQEKSFEGKGYTVAVSSFYIDKYEVTIEQYCEFLNDGNEGYRTAPSYPRIKRGAGGRFVPASPDMARIPVAAVNYYQATGYAEWAGKRLPTEAEWEYAAGGRQSRKYPWGDEEPGKTRANYGPIFGDRKPVGSFPGGRKPEGV